VRSREVAGVARKTERELTKEAQRVQSRSKVDRLHLVSALFAHRVCVMNLFPL